MWHRSVRGTVLPAGAVVPAPAEDDAGWPAGEPLPAPPAVLDGVAGDVDDAEVEPVVPEVRDCAAVTEPENEHAVTNRTAGSSVRATRPDDGVMAPR